MSASIYWEPIKKRVSGLGVDTPSSFIEAMRETFGDGSSWELGPEALTKLKAMAAVGRQSFGGDKCNPYAELVEALEESEHIRVWAEW